LALIVPVPFTLTAPVARKNITPPLIPSQVEGKKLIPVLTVTLV